MTNLIKCKSCEKEISEEKAILCEWCNREIEEEEEELEYTLDKRQDDREPHLFCKKCTKMCDACEIRGCEECVTFACCDCGYYMCVECRDNEVDCGCYGHCYSCRTDVNRGEDGWPCGECEKWYCRDCIRCDNPCKECGPEEEEEESDDTDNN